MNELQYPRGDGNVFDTFRERVREIGAMHFLELGTKRWGDAPTHHKHLFPDAVSYTLSDIEPGEDVDLVIDAHCLDLAFSVPCIDALLACSVWEHLERPWIAAAAIERVITPGGLFFVQTHFVFPEHGYPNDFFRFTIAGLRSIFEWADDVVCAYDYPAAIMPQNPEVEWNDAAPAFLNVNITGRKR